jgi:hypothetical protein
MLSKLRGLGQAIIAVAIVSAAAPALAHAQSGPIVTEIPVPASVIESPCIAGEFVNLSGKIVIAEYARTNGTTTHFTFRVITKMQGTTLDLFNPKKYVLNDEDVTEFNQGGATETTHEINTVMVRQSESGIGTIDIGGFGDDFKGKTKMHFTFNALGVPTATVDDITFTCM